MRRRALIPLVFCLGLVAFLLVGPVAQGGAKKLEVRVIHCCPVNVGSWDPTHAAVYTKLAKANNWNLEVAEAVPYGEADQVLDRWGREGVDIVFSTDSGFNENILRAAAKYADTKWIVMSDLAPNDLPNVASYAVSWCDFAFLQGAAAAFLSKTHKVGVVTGLPLPITPKYTQGYRFGANTAVKGTKVDIKFSGDWIDPTKKAETASALISKGADVLIAFDTVNDPTATRAQAAGKLYVGSYKDEASLAPKATVTSVTINLQQTYGDAAKAVTGGTFAPEIRTYGIKQGFVRILPFRLGNGPLRAKVQAIANRLATGKLRYPSGACAG